MTAPLVLEPPVVGELVTAPLVLEPPVVGELVTAPVVAEPPVVGEPMTAPVVSAPPVGTVGAAAELVTVPEEAVPLVALGETEPVAEEPDVAGAVGAAVGTGLAVASETMAKAATGTEAAMKAITNEILRKSLRVFIYV